MYKILMLVNWKIEYAAERPEGKQSPDYYVKGGNYWFFKWFQDPVQVDVIDIRSFSWLENFERNRLRFYVWQTLRAIPRLHNYDLVISHGAQSGILLCLWRRLFRGKEKHILFDIGSFNSAAESGMALKLMQWASGSLDGMIYHTSKQIEYYKKYFPWLVTKSKFIRFGTDNLYFSRTSEDREKQKYILCVGYQKRDWKTLIRAYGMMAERLEAGEESIPELRLIGRCMEIEDILPPSARIIMKPYIPLEELIDHIQNSLFDVVPLEDFNYSFGQMTLLQQMALGKAVIAARVPSMTDYVEEDRTALCYTAGDAEELCRKMIWLFENGDAREQIEKNAAAYVKEQYNEKKMALQIEEYLKQILKA